MKPLVQSPDTKPKGVDHRNLPALDAARCPLLLPLLFFMLGLLLEGFFSPLLRISSWISFFVLVLLVLLGAWYAGFSRSRWLNKGAWIGTCLLLGYLTMGTHRANIRFTPARSWKLEEIKTYRAYLTNWGGAIKGCRKQRRALTLQAEMVHLGGGKIAPFKQQILLCYSDTNAHFQMGTEFWIASTPRLMSANYGKQRGERHFTDYASPKELIRTGRRRGSWLWNGSQDLRRQMQLMLQERGLALAASLLLGKHEGLSPDLRRNFGATGVMHLLAVSGLHIGILYALFYGLLSCFPIGRLRWLLPIVFLWIFALIAGLSPSVLRATFLCSFLAIGRYVSRQGFAFNSLSAAAFFILLLWPEKIFSVSFQLSFLAVFGILIYYKLLRRAWTPRHYVLTIIYDSVCVSIAAQLAIFPLGVYYFKELSLIFPLANLLLLPCLFIALPLTLLYVGVLPLSEGLSAPLGFVLKLLLGFMEWVAATLAAAPGSHLYPFVWRPVQLGLVYVSLFFVTYYLYFRYPIYAYLGFISLLIYVLIGIL